MTMRALRLAVLVAFLGLAGAALADVDMAHATPAPSPAAAPATTPAAVYAPPAPTMAPLAQNGGSTFQLGLYFMLLIALLGGGFYVMRNGLDFLRPKPKGPRKLEISETRVLGNRQFLIVAEYEHRKMLIGVCPGRIDYLCTLSGAEPEFPRLPAEEES